MEPSHIHISKAGNSDIFTPDSISQIMATKLMPSFTPLPVTNHQSSLLEPSVGTGNLLKYLDLAQYERIDVFDINPLHLNGIPISMRHHPNLQTHESDFLKWEFHNQKYTHIILNPPYIRIQHLPKEYVTWLKTTWTLCNGGNIDLYYAFLIKCIELLADNGRMVAITPNSYLHNKSAIRFRQFLFQNNLIEEIIDYKETKVFKGVSVYCCITIFTKAPKQQLIYNSMPIDYATLCHSSNQLCLLHCPHQILTSTSTSTSTSIQQSPLPQPQPPKLGDLCNIYNGIATLRDRVFIHNQPLFNEPCWKRIKTPSQYKSCIYPYDENGGILEEQLFKETNPQTYDYLISMKSELQQRDRGHGNYSAWYAYGRTQSLIVSKKEKVIYVPTFIDPSNPVFEIASPPTLHVSCLCIEPKSPVVTDAILNMFINTITQNMEFIKNNSNVKSNGWITLSSTLLKQLPTG